MATLSDRLLAATVSPVSLQLSDLPPTSSAWGARWEIARDALDAPALAHLIATAPPPEERELVLADPWSAQITALTRSPWVVLSPGPDDPMLEQWRQCLALLVEHGSAVDGSHPAESPPIFSNVPVYRVSALQASTALKMIAWLLEAGANPALAIAPVSLGPTRRCVRLDELMEATAPPEVARLICVHATLWRDRAALRAVAAHPHEPGAELGRRRL